MIGAILLGLIAGTVGRMLVPDMGHGCRGRDSNPRHADYDSAALTD